MGCGGGGGSLGIRSSSNPFVLLLGTLPLWEESFDGWLSTPLPSGILFTLIYFG